MTIGNIIAEMAFDSIEFRHKRTFPNRGILAAGFFFGCLCVLLCMKNPSLTAPYLLDLHMETTTPGSGEFYYGVRGTYSKTRRGWFTLRSTGEPETYRLSFPSRLPVDHVRIDPGKGAGQVAFTSLVITGPRDSLMLGPQEIADAIVVSHQMVPISGPPGKISFRATGNDPYLELAIPTDAAYNPYLVYPLAFLIGFTLTALLGWASTRLSPPARIPPGSGGNFLWITLDFQARILLVLCLVTAVILVAGRFHFSSMAMWDHVVPQENLESTVLQGRELNIRSDEWGVWTPFTLNQVLRGWPVRNASIGYGHSPMLAFLPTGGLPALFQPKYWGFAIFDLERGFAWLWAYKTIGLFASLFLLFLLLTDSNTPLALLGAVWVYGSSFSQWWFSIFSEITTAFCWIVVSGCLLAYSSRKAALPAAALLLLFASVNFLLHLYPPWQIPLTFLGIAIFLGMAVSTRQRLREIRWVGTRALLLCTAVLLVVLVFGSLAMDAQESIKVMRETVYPGNRLAQGGDWTVWRVFTGFFDQFALSEKSFPEPFGNAVRASGFYLLFPIIPVILCFSGTTKRQDGLLWALLLYCLAIIVWMVGGYPAVVAHLTLLDRCPEPRALLGLGLASIFATVRFLSLAPENSFIQHRRLAFLALVLSIALFGWLCLQLHQVDSRYFTMPRLLFAMALFAVSCCALLISSSALLLVALTPVLVVGLTINPLTKGLDAIFGKEVSSVVQQELNASPDSRWLITDSLFLPQFFKALGANVFNGVNYIPIIAEKRVLDPTGAYQSIWNRYAHVVVTFDAEIAEAAFTLKQGDVYAVQLNPCSPALHALSINRFIVPASKDVSAFTCLDPAWQAPLNGLMLYRNDHSADP